MFSTEVLGTLSYFIKSIIVYFSELKYDTTVSVAEWPSKQFENLMKTELMERFKADGVQTEFLNADK